MPRHPILIAALLLAVVGSLAGKPTGPVLGPSAQGGRGAFKAKLAMAQQQLHSGRFEQALQLFQSILKANPSHRRARFGVGAVYAAQARCAEAAAALDPIRGSKTFGEKGFIVEAQCAMETGDYAGAVERLEEATKLSPRDEKAWFQLVLARQAAGDIEGAWEAFEELEKRDLESLTTALAEARLTMGTADYPRARAVLDGRTGHLGPDSRKLLALHGARADLLDGAPDLAKEALLPLARSDLSNQTYGFLRAEACRRAGDLECAAFAVDRKAMQVETPIPMAYVIRARVYADLGRLDDAREQLAQHPHPSDPELVASSWYVARAAGEDTAHLEAVYAVLGRPDTGDLSLLIPRSAP